MPIEVQVKIRKANGIGEPSNLGQINQREQEAPNELNGGVKIIREANTPLKSDLTLPKINSVKNRTSRNVIKITDLKLIRMNTTATQKLCSAGVLRIKKTF